ncbi:MAG: 50S ribosomal protein L25 [Bdellovibrionaceae bacterium]|nr:50S ribosomal protein L25 [Pseudobdellovibrionaceae bacterium]|tara:strand:- start:3392 stop:4024 length:633 start_codon:yes stop_codon:yes gene_type:complete
MSYQLKVEKRDLKKGDKAKRLRRNGYIPGVFQGLGKENIPIQIKEDDLKKALRSGEHVFKVSVDQGAEELAAIQQIQKTSYPRRFLHAEFLRLKAGQMTHVTVPVVLEGNPAGVKEGGVLAHVLREIEISCTPENVPEHIVVNVDSVGMNETIRVENLQAPPGVNFLSSDLEKEILHVKPPKAEKVVEETVVIGEEEATVEESADEQKAG